jgi:hypothetical protein
MSLTTIMTESQDYLLQSGDPEAMADLLPDVLRTLGRALPIWGNISWLADTWVAGRWSDATQTVTDLTTAAQGAGSVGVSTLTSHDGLLLGAVGLFPEVTFTLSTAHAGGTPVYEWSYWNGQRWVVLTPLLTPTLSVVGTPQTLRFLLPDDWVASTLPGVSLPATFPPVQYWLRLRATTPPTTTAAVASLVTVVRTLFPLPETALQLLALHYMPRELEPVVVTQAMDLLDPTWRSRRDTPIRYTQDLTRLGHVQLTPLPTALAAQGIPPFSGIPGAVASDQYVVFLTLDTPPLAWVPEWVEGLVALALAAREAGRQGETMDPALSQTLDGVVRLVVAMLRESYRAFGGELDRSWSSERVDEVLP